MRKSFGLIAFFIVALFFSVAQVFGVEAPASFKEYLLPNGMSVFVYEDFSTPIVRVEYSAKAGVSMQNAENAGFLPLYAELFSNAGKYAVDSNTPWMLDDLQSECNADSARFTINCIGAELRPILEQISACAFAPIFSDDELQKKFNATKESVKQNAFSVETFINGSIDSRVFSDAPWKHDSGVYPAMFENKTLSDVRVILKQISQKYYSPQNSALFVSGAVHAQTVLQFAQETFGTYAPSTKSATTMDDVFEKNIASQGSSRKFVLSDNELTTEMSQVVVQYTSLTMEQADIAAIILNLRYSMLKMALTENAVLNIRADEYINADAAHKNGSSRFILQTLLEKTNATAFEQSAAFEEVLKENIANFSIEEFEFAKQFLVENFENTISASSNFMDLFSQFWAVEGINSTEKIGAQNQSVLQRFLNRPQSILNQNYESLKAALQNEEPWIFILLNTKTFSPLQEKFAAAGYESVTAKNGSWYTQELYKNLRKPAAEESVAQNAIPIYDSDFASQNKASIQSAILKNGIRVTIKQNPASKRAAIAFYIAGGEAYNAQDNYGMETIFTEILAQNIFMAGYDKYQKGRLYQMFSCEPFVSETNSVIAIDCALADSLSVVECIGIALFYSNFAPADVDIALSARRSKQITKTANLGTQLFAAGVKNFYKSAVYRTLYSTQKDILKNLKYNDVLEAYPKLLDASRIEIIASGNIDSQKFIAECERVFGNLFSSQKTESVYEEPSETKKHSLKVKLTHTFLTDVSADKAGPRPAVLIPTTDFSDPIQYWIKSPTAFEKESAIFDALFLELEDICKKNIAAQERFSKMTTRIEEKTALIPFGALTFFNVKSISDADLLLEKSLEELKAKLLQTQNQDAETSPDQFDLLEPIKARWIKRNYQDAFDNTATVKNIAEKINLARLSGNDNFNAEQALVQDYETVTLATAQDFMEVFEKYFAPEPFKLYSADAKQ